MSCCWGHCLLPHTLPCRDALPHIGKPQEGVPVTHSGSLHLPMWCSVTSTENLTHHLPRKAPLAVPDRLGSPCLQYLFCLPKRGCFPHQGVVID